MVPPSSATQHWPNETARPVTANHSDIAKLKKDRGSIFRSVSIAIKRALDPTAQIHFFNDCPSNQAERDRQVRPTKILYTFRL